MLGRGDRVAERRIHHDDAARRRRRDVDIIHADAGAADHFESLRPLQHFCRDFGRGTDRQPVEAVDRLGELVLVLAQIGLEFDLNAAVLEDRDSGGRECVRDENFGGHGVFFLHPAAQSFQVESIEAPAF